jgi:hypothetical protein
MKINKLVIIFIGLMLAFGTQDIYGQVFDETDPDGWSEETCELYPELCNGDPILIDEICIGCEDEDDDECYECWCDPFWCDDDPLDDCPEGYDDCGECGGDNFDGCVEEDCPSGDYDICGVCDGDDSSCENEKNCDKAKLANHVYNTLFGSQVPGEDPLNVEGGELMNPNATVFNDLNFAPTDSSSGFNSSIYKVTHENGETTYIMSFAGTDDMPDAVTDIEQALGITSEQYDYAYDNAIAFAAWANLNGYNISFTGHSLGGGLANLAALATGYPATIFNAAGLHSNTISNPNYQLDLANSSLVEAFVISGEIVSEFNTILQTPIRGNINTISPKLGLGREILFAITPGGGLVRSGILHTMGEVLKSMDCD